MVKRFRYRIYPTQEQEEVFQKNFGCCRFVYNWALDLKIKHYEAAKALQLICDNYSNNMVVSYHRLKRSLRLKKIIAANGPIYWTLLREGAAYDNNHKNMIVSYDIFKKAIFLKELIATGTRKWWTLVRAPKIKQLSSYDLSQYLTQLKKNPEFSWLKEVNSISLNTAIAHLETAFANFFRRLKTGETPGFPQFKKKHKSGKSFSFHQAYTVDFNRNKIKLMKVGEVRAVLHCRKKILETGEVVKVKKFEGQCKTATILQEPSGKYYISIVVKDELKEPSPLPLSIQKMVGIDHGIAHALTLSDGRVFNTNMEFKELDRQLVRRQRSLARKEKGTENFKKNKIKVAIKYEEIRHSRKYIIENLILDLINYLKEKGYISVAIRKYNIEKMVRKIEPIEEPQASDTGEPPVKKFNKNGRSQQKQLNKRTLNAALGMVFQQLKYKCGLEGINCIELDAPEEKTTHKCSFCAEEGAIHINKVSREFECKKCGYTDDMDVNAAKNCVLLAAKSVASNDIQPIRCNTL